MAQATIGSLNVILGMDAGDFNAAVRQVEGGINKLAAKFGFIAGVAAEVGRQLVQSLGNALVGLAGMFRHAIDSADAMDELAQKLGLTVEALSQIQYAAHISGVPIETLTQGITKLSAALGDIAGGDTKSDAARTLQALGISAMESTGQLKSMDVLLTELADKFAGFKDTTEKTALAVNLFGKSGAQLIPFLNQGRAGIAELRAEAERLGISLTDKGAKAAGAFNESMDKLTATMNAGFKKAMQEALPFLQQAVSWLIENDRAFKFVKGAVDLLVNSIKFLATTYIALELTIKNAATRLMSFATVAAQVAQLDFTEAGARWGEATAEITKRSQEATDAIDSMWGAMGGPTGQQVNREGKSDKLDPNAPTGGGDQIAPIVTSTQALAEASKAATSAQALHNEQLQKWNELRREARQVEEDLMDPSERMAAQQDKLNRLLQRGALDADTYGRAMQKATLVSLNSYANMASGIAQNLSKVFGDNQAFAIASAIINTAESVTKTLATYGYTPWGIAAAAAAAAAGLAEIATIRSASKGGGGSSGSGLSSGSSASGSGGQAGGGGEGQTMTVQGMNSNQLFTGDRMHAIVDGLLAMQRDGVNIVLAKNV